MQTLRNRVRRMIMVCPVNRLPETLGMGQRFFDMTEEPGAFNPISFLHFWEDVYNRDCGALIVDEKDGVFTGAIGVVLSIEPLTGDRILTEQFWYSEGSAGVKLLSFAEAIADNLNIKAFYLQHMAKDADKFGKFYTKKGFNLRYYRYAKEY